MNKGQTDRESEAKYDTDYEPVRGSSGSIAYGCNVTEAIETWIWLIAAGLVGAAAASTLVATYFKVSRAQKQLEGIPGAVSMALPGLATAGVVLGPKNKLIRATPGAYALGLIHNQSLAHDELVDLANSARRGKSAGKAKVRQHTITARLGDSKHFVESRAFHLGDGHVLLSVDDKTESQALDATRRDFVANISHELKTPIGSISLLTEAIQSAADDPERVQQFTQSLQTESARLAELVQDIIELSRVQSAEISRRSKPVNLADVIAEAISRNQITAASSGIEIKIKRIRNIKVFGNFDLLVAAVKNLIENAIMHSGTGEPIKVSLRKTKGTAEIAVQDRGKGIPAKELDRVFERFYRVDPSRSRATGGTGLGLSIAKNVAVKHMGEITVKSKPGRGSTFTIKLPVAEMGNE